MRPWRIRRKKSGVVASRQSLDSAHMNHDQRELVQRLFAAATVIASEAEGNAIAGQSPKVTLARYRATAFNLIKRSDDLLSIAKTIIAIASLK
jgi:hypothetical protein